MADRDSRWSTPLLDYALHALIGTGMFMIFALPAIAIDMFIQHCDQWVSTPLLTILKGAEYALILTDISLFLVYLTRVFLKAGRELLLRRIP
jgi:hypothetical protein